MTIAAARLTHCNDPKFKKGWQVYKFPHRVINPTKALYAKQVATGYLGNRIDGDLVPFSAIRNPSGSGHPAFVASRVEYQGVTFLDTNYSEHHHGVVAYTLGPWERRIPLRVGGTLPKNNAWATKANPTSHKPPFRSLRVKARRGRIYSRIFGKPKKSSFAGHVRGSPTVKTEDDADVENSPPGLGKSPARGKCSWR